MISTSFNSVNFYNKISEELLDPVSFEPMSEAQVLLCGHTFDKSTIDDITNLGKLNCATCRAPFKSSLPDYAVRKIVKTFNKIEDTSSSSELQGFKESLEKELLDAEAVILNGCGHSFSPAKVEEMIKSSPSLCSSCKTPFNDVAPHFTIRNIAAQCHQKPQLEVNETQEITSSSHLHLESILASLNQNDLDLIAETMGQILAASVKIPAQKVEVSYYAFNNENQLHSTYDSHPKTQYQRIVSNILANELRKEFSKGHTTREYPHPLFIGWLKNNEFPLLAQKIESCFPTDFNIQLEVDPNKNRGIQGKEDLVFSIFVTRNGTKATKTYPFRNLTYCFPRI